MLRQEFSSHCFQGLTREIMLWDWGDVEACGNYEWPHFTTWLNNLWPVGSDG